MLQTYLYAPVALPNVYIYTYVYTQFCICEIKARNAIKINETTNIFVAFAWKINEISV